MLVGLGDAVPHVGIRLDVLHAVIVHDAEVPAPESVCHGLGHFGFCLNHVGTGFFRLGFHFLLQRDRHGTPFFRFGLGDVLVGVCLVHLEGSPDVTAYIDVGYINREDFKSGTGVQPFAEHELRDRVGVFQYRLMILGRADARYDAFAYACQDGIFACASHQLADVGAHRYAGFGDELDAVFCHGGHRRRVNHLRVDRHLYRLEHVTSGKVDARCHLEGKLDVGFRCRYQRVHHFLHVSACHVVGFQFITGDGVQSCLVGFYHGGHDDMGRHVTDAHQEKLYQ